MEIKVPYGHGWLTVDCPVQNLAGVVYPREVPPGDEQIIMREALMHPLEANLLEAFLADGTETLCIVNDATRPTPTPRILDYLVEPLQSSIKFLVATGSHRPPTPAECRQIFGPRFKRFQKDIFIHDARVTEAMVSLGTTTRATPLAINRLIVETPKIIALSSVEPHYFAGYTGGRKSFFPGAAAYETIEQNHYLALHQEAAPLTLTGNPVHEDLVEAMGYLAGKEIYSLQVVLDRNHRICAAFCGSLAESFAAAAQKAKEVFTAELDERADIVVSVAPAPLDIDLYQAHKALEHGKRALKPGGILILVAQCPGGIGNDRFYQLLSRAATPAEVSALITDAYHLGDHKAAKIAALAKEARLWGVTDLDPTSMQKAFIKPFTDLQDAMEAAIAEQGPNAQCLFLMNASMLVPIIKEMNYEYL
jgi:nickel-dependent lactate racemase